MVLCWYPVTYTIIVYTFHPFLSASMFGIHVLSVAYMLCKPYVYFLIRLTSKKLTGHIGFGLFMRTTVRLSMHVSVCQEQCMLGFCNFIYGFVMEK